MKSAAIVIRCTIVLLILSWSMQASAQASPDMNQTMLYTSKYYKYKKMKTIGLVLTLGGGILGVVGINKMANAPSTTTYVNGQAQTTYSGPDGAQGAAMFLLSIPMVGTGVPLAIVGSIKTKKYGALMERTTIGAGMNPQGGAGVRLTYKF